MLFPYTHIYDLFIVIFLGYQRILPEETAPAAKTKEGQSLWQWAWAYIDRTHQPSLPTISDNTSDSNSIFSSSSNSSSGGEGSSSSPPALQG